MTMYIATTHNNYKYMNVAKHNSIWLLIMGNNSKANNVEFICIGLPMEFLEWHWVLVCLTKSLQVLYILLTYILFYTVRDY